MAGILNFINLKIRWETFRYNFRENTETPMNLYRFSFVYKMKLNNDGEVSAGLQPQLVKQQGSFNFDSLNFNLNAWETEALLNHHSSFSREIVAGFVNYTGGWNNFSYIAGLRLEYSNRKLEPENRNYLNLFNNPELPEYMLNRLDWFPVLHVKYGLTDNTAFIFAASRRVNRPSVNLLAPFLSHVRLESNIIGNPALEPEYLNNVEVTVDKQIGQQNLALTGFIRGTNNAIVRISKIYAEENVLVDSYANSGEIRTVGGEFSAGLTAGKTARFYLGAALYNFDIQNDSLRFSENNKATGWSLKGNIDLLPVQPFKFTLDFDVHSAATPFQQQTETFFTSNAAVIFEPEKMPGWDFSLKILDILGSYTGNFTRQAYQTDGTPLFRRKVENSRFGPIVELSARFLLNRKIKTADQPGQSFEKQF